MKKCIKSLFVAVIACFCLATGGITVHAQTVNEVDSNDTMETAQLIQANSETAAQAVSGSRPDQYVVNGYISSKDVDWYKVYLEKGTQYVTCNGNPFVFEVYDADNNLLKADSYTKSGFGMAAYAFEAASAGYYYVKITGTTSSTKSYILSVGGPSYTNVNCVVKFDTVTMTGGTDKTLQFDLREENRLPDKAVVYEIIMNGLRTTSVDSIAVTNLTMNRKITLGKYSWSKNGLVTANLALKSHWQIDFGYYTDTSFTPSITLSFVYPVVSEYLKDDIVITQ